MVSFVNFERIASICVDFRLGTLHRYFFHSGFWPNLNFPLEYQIKLVLISCYWYCGLNVYQPYFYFLHLFFMFISFQF